MDRTKLEQFVQEYREHEAPSASVEFLKNLALALENGTERPKTFAERQFQIALIRKGLLPSPGG